VETERLRLIGGETRAWLAFLLTSLLALPGFSHPSAPPPRQSDGADATFQRAVRMRTSLESKPESKRSKSEYENAIRTFGSVYHLDPAYGKTPVALGAVGDLYEEMGRVFSADRYFLEAIKAYEFLISQYPYSGAARDAWFATGEIYQAELENPEAARQAFQHYLESHPKSGQAAKARERLRQLDALLAEPTAKPRRPAESPRPGAGAVVTEIRRWVGPNYSRIVIGVEDEVKFETARLSHPDRIVLDLANTRLSPALVGKKFPVEDGYLRQIRAAQFTPSVTRVVLDVQEIDEYTVIPLPNPFRLVIDIHGAAAAATAKAQRPTPPPSPADHPPVETPAPSSESAPTVKPALDSQSAANPEAKVASTIAKSAPDSEKSTTKIETEPVESASVKSAPPPPRRREEAPLPLKPAAPTEAGSRTLTRALGLKIGRMVIDPGHGGHDTGTIGPTGLLEKDVVLDVGLRLRRLLEHEVGCEVVMTREDDTFIPLEERTAIANEKGADLFISIHANASRDRSARGIETYYLNFTSSPDALEVAARENATSQESVHELQDLIKKIALTEKIEESQEFARQVQHEVHQRVAKASGEQRDRGVKKAPFVVLIGANMPSILAEISFLTNPRDERLLKRQDYRQKIAEALYHGVLLYVRNLGGIKVAQRAGAMETSASTRPEF
jgi:N-acetylmuramoyl-L-alanine amidase